MATGSIRFFAVLTFIVGTTGCNGTKTVFCPPTNRPVSVPKSAKSASKLYADAVKDFSANLKATVNVVEQVTVGIDKAEVKSDAVLLKDKLNQESIRYQDALKASYLGLTVDPCLYSEHHAKLVESLSGKNYELQQLKATLESGKSQQSSPNYVAQVDSTFKGYLYQRGKNEGAAMAKLTKALGAYYQQNSKYPVSIEDLRLDDVISVLGTSRLDYKLVADREFTLRFAGGDFVLGTLDDKSYKGIDGATNRVQ